MKISTSTEFLPDVTHRSSGVGTLAGRTFRISTDRLLGDFRVVMVDKRLGLIGLFRLKVETRENKLVIAKSEAATWPIFEDAEWFASLRSPECVELEIALPPTCNKPLAVLFQDARAAYDYARAIMAEATAPTLLRRSVTDGNCRPLQEIADTAEVQLTTIKRMAARVFTCGSDGHKAALCWALGWGDRKPRLIDPQVRQGRKPKNLTLGHADPKFVTPTEKQECIIQVFMQTMRASDREGKPDAVVHREFLSHCHDLAGSAANSEEQEIYQKLIHLSVDQFRTRFKAFERPLRRMLARVGRRKFNKDLRALVGTARDLVQYPGQVYIIDSTVADIYLVSAFDRKLLIGRPVVYFVIDAFSSVILAVHVTLRPPCNEEAMIALYHAMAPKELRLAALDIPIYMHDFLPQGCRPLEVFGDRGELLSQKTTEAFSRSRIDLALAAAYRGDCKSLVERRFGIFNQELIHWLPGGARGRKKERGDRDHRLDAVCTVAGFTRLLTMLAAEQNATKNMAEHLSTALLDGEIEASPIGFWEYGLEALHGSPKFLDRLEAISELVQPMEAHCRRGGFLPVAGTFLEGLRFTGAWMRDDDEFYDDQGAEVQLYQDPDRPGYAFVWRRGEQELREVKVVGKEISDADPAVYNIYDIVDWNAYLGAIGREHTGNSVATRLKFKESQNEAIAQEKSATEAAMTGDMRSPRSRVNNMDTNRKTEIGQMRAGDQSGLPAASQVTSPPPVPKSHDHGYEQSMNTLFGDIT